MRRAAAGYWTTAAIRFYRGAERTDARFPSASGATSCRLPPREKHKLRRSDIGTIPLVTELWKIRLRDLQRFRAHGAGAWFFLLILLRFFAQSCRRIEYGLRCRTGHDLVHRVCAKVNAAGPFHAAEIRIDGDGVENAGVQQF